MRVLIIEDEPQLLEQLSTALTRAGYSVDRASNGKEGLYFGTEYNYDIAIVDLGLPLIEGMEVIRRWRVENRIFPVLVLTARGSWQDKVQGLETGADDYVVKPFHMEEVVARVNALVRRAAGIAHSTIKRGPIELDTHKKLVRVSGELLELTSYEYKVLEYLMMHPDELVSKAVLTEHIYAQDFERDSNTIEVFIGRLRKKLDPANTLKPIETVRGMGYRLNAVMPA